MKTTKFTLAMAVVFAASSLLFTDCRKKEKKTEEPQDTDQSTAADNSLAENTSNDVLSMGSQVSENSGTLTTFKMNGNIALPQQSTFTGEELGLATASCAVVTPGTGTIAPLTPSTWTIDFGTTGCTGADGRVRTGKLFFDFSQSAANANRYRKPGFKMIVTSQNYVVDGNAVSITKTVTNTSPLAIAGQTAYSGTNLTWSIVSNVTINKNGGGTVTWTCNRTKELSNSNDPLCYKGQNQAIDWTKAKITLNGSASGTNANNESYSVVATNLMRDFTCAPDVTKPHRHPFVSGTVDYTPGNKATRHIDYGTGTCDFNATITINGQTWAITLP